jgi:hypothetical protein
MERRMKKTMPDFLHHPLAREIALAIVIKLLVIVALFYAFFDGRAVDTDADSVAARLVNSPQHAQH